MYLKLLLKHLHNKILRNLLIENEQFWSINQTFSLLQIPDALRRINYHNLHIFQHMISTFRERTYINVGYSRWYFLRSVDIKYNLRR